MELSRMTCDQFLTDWSTSGLKSNQLSDGSEVFNGEFYGKGRLPLPCYRSCQSFT
jgi:hypothetical protein